MMNRASLTNKRHSKSIFQIFPFAHAYLAELTDLWVSAWEKVFSHIDFEQRRVWFVEHLTTLHAKGHAIMCAFDIKNGTLAGFVTVERTTGQMDQLAVAVGYWGSGVAAELLEAAKKLSPGKLTLEVNQDNRRAVRFYEKSGFHRLGEGVNPNSGLKTWRYDWVS